LRGGDLLELTMDRRSRNWLLGIVAVSLLLNLWGIDFGLPERWHPDELTSRAIAMAGAGSLNPHEFRYGSLHFYQILAVIVPTYLVTELLGLDQDTQVNLVVLAARALSALLGAGCVAMTFLLARRLFDTTTAILSAAFLGLSAGFVNHAHFATVDVPMAFWMTASFLMSAEVLLTGRRRAYVLAGLFAGLAAATKYPGVMALLCLPVAHLLVAGRRDHVSLLLGCGASVVAFAVANPPLFLASCEFFEGVIRDNAYSSTQGITRAIVPLLLTNLERGLGSLLLVAVGLSLVYALALLFQPAARSRVLLILAMIIPTTVLLLNLNASYVRFMLPVFPPLALLAGKAAADLLGARAGYLRLAGSAAVAAVLAVSALTALAVDLQMVHDSRELAADWVARNVPAGATIEITPYVAQPDESRFRVTPRPFIHNVAIDSWIERLSDSPIYRALQPLYLAYEAFAEEIGICAVRPNHYRGWYDQQREEQVGRLESFDYSLAGLESRAPDFLIVSEEYYRRYAGDTLSVEGRFFADLLGGRSSYREVAEIQYRALPWPDPKVSFINPTVRIYRRTE
jgi:hypothetical protein